MIGGLFGALFGTRIHDYSRGYAYGALWGTVWWILGGLILMPVFLDMPAFAPLQMPLMRVAAIGSLVGHLIYDLILGGVYARLSHARAVPLMRPLT